VAGSYLGRFAPSPTGPLHAGSLVAALASWLDARAHGGQWLVRIEDADSTRCHAAWAEQILQQLARCGLHSDRPPVYQSQRSALYAQALDTLVQCGMAYPCGCTRQDIDNARQQQGASRPRHSALVYPGTCRHGLGQRSARAWRLRTDVYIEKEALALAGQAQTAINFVSPSNPSGGAEIVLEWTDRRLGRQRQNVSAQVGDFVLKRADGCFAYQLAVVVDDAAQGITDIVRGADLADNTARQILLQHALGLPTPRYLHTPLVLDAQGEKLSKQNGARAINTDTADAAQRALTEAAAVLGLVAPHSSHAPDLSAWVAQWQSITRTTLDGLDHHSLRPRDDNGCGQAPLCYGADRD